MKIEIELDPGKIDYDAINKQIIEKVSSLNIEDDYDIKLQIDRKISDMISKHVEYSYNEYLDTYWKHSPTSEGRSLIENISKEEIQKRTNQVMEEIFSNEYTEDMMRDIMIKMIPDVFTSILFKRLETALFDKEYNYSQQTQNMVKSIVSFELNKRR